MKKVKSSISFGGIISIYRASAYVKKLLCPIKDFTAFGIFSHIAGPHEELQIVYANIRV